MVNNFSVHIIPKKKKFVFLYGAPDIDIVAMN